MLLAGLQTNHNVRKKKFGGKFKTFYEGPDWSFEVLIQRCILNFEVSDQSFKSGGGTRETF